MKGSRNKTVSIRRERPRVGVLRRVLGHDGAGRDGRGEGVVSLLTRQDVGVLVTALVVEAARSRSQAVPQVARSPLTS